MVRQLLFLMCSAFAGCISAQAARQKKAGAGGSRQPWTNINPEDASQILRLYFCLAVVLSYAVLRQIYTCHGQVHKLESS
jgi:hypothetical protein